MDDARIRGESCNGRGAEREAAQDTILDTVLRAATAILRPVLGSDVTLVDPRVLRDQSRSLVLRCRVLGTSASDPTSVVVKHFLHDVERGFDEWASLLFLSRRDDTARLVPRIIAGDAEARTIVMEDLGDGATLHDLLIGPDADAVRQALRTLALRYADLHAATVGREAEYAGGRARLPIAAASGRKQEAEDWRGRIPRVERWFDATKVALPTDWRASLDQVARAYADPGPFLSFTHGDPAPTNNHVTGDRVRLLDFEYGGFRHALYDLTAWHVLCPLPEDIVDAMSTAYRDRVEASWPVMREDDAYRAAWADMSVYRAVWMLSAIGPGVLVENRPHVGDWTAREAAFAATSRLARTVAEVPGLAPIAEASQALSRALRARWGYATEPLPRWPALSSAPAHSR